MSSIDPDLRKHPAVKAQLDIFKTHTRIFKGVTGIATGIDASDKKGVWDKLGYKDATTIGNDW